MSDSLRPHELQHASFKIYISLQQQRGRGHLSPIKSKYSKAET